MSTTTPPKATIVNPSPKMRFMALPTGIITAHQSMVRSENFATSADYALLDMIRKIVENQSNTNEALAGFYQIQGAHMLLQSMTTLAEKPVAPRIHDEGQNLDHNA